MLARRPKFEAMPLDALWLSKVLGSFAIGIVTRLLLRLLL